MMRSSNPTLSDKVFSSVPVTSSEIMTLDGTVNKCVIMLGLLIASASISWTHQIIGPAMLIGGIGGLIFALATIFKKNWSEKSGNTLLNFNVNL